MKQFVSKKGIVLFAILFATTIIIPTQSGLALFRKKEKGLRVLVIGDSNTEIGNITMAFAAMLDSMHGDNGSGYCTLNPNSIGRVKPGIKVHCDSNWNLFDMRNDFKPEEPPYYSPDGLSISSSTKGAVTSLDFTGNAIDVYYLEQNSAGRFSIAIDGVEKKMVKTEALGNTTKKVSINQLAPGSHQLTVTVVSGSVTLLGIDAIKGDKRNERFVLHKWGNAWASTQDFVNISRKVFTSALQQLDPNKIVILLGTNDHNLDHRNAEDVKRNLIALISRIKEALPAANILLVSTFNCDGAEAQNILPEYVAKSFPQAAKETNTTYWDMNTWFGPYSPDKLRDGVHVNENYGKQVAAELLRHLE